MPSLAKPRRWPSSVGPHWSFPCVARIGIGSCIQAFVAALRTTCCAHGSKRIPYRSVSLSGTSRTWILRATDDRIGKPTVSNPIDSSHGSIFQPRMLAMCARQTQSACSFVPRHGTAQIPGQLCAEISESGRSTPYVVSGPPWLACRSCTLVAIVASQVRSPTAGLRTASETARLLCVLFKCTLIAFLRIRHAGVALRF